MLSIFYYKDQEGNFGDDINEFLWEELIPGVWSNQQGTRFAGIGTILSPWMPADGSWIIFGSGTGYGTPAIDLHSAAVQVPAVRGPLTAKVLGLPSSAAATDGAILLSKLERYSPLPAAERSGVTFIPHRSALGEGDWESVCADAGVRFLSPRGDCETILQAIRSSKLVIADSMHAAIVADTFRVPWIAVRTGAEINAFKWMDWASSMSVPYDPVDLPPSTLAEAWRSYNIRWRVSRWKAPPSSTEEAIASYRDLDGVVERQGLLYKSKPFRASLKVARGVPAVVNDMFRRRAAKELRALSEKDGNLSEQAIFEMKRDDMFDRLKSVEAQVRSGGVVAAGA